MSRFASEYRAAQYARRETEKQARTNAFGAIRAAARIAREYDNGNSIDVHLVATGIRRAIRQAITASQAPRTQYEAKP